MQTSRPSADNVHVSCRFRPLSSGERNGGLCVHLEGSNHVVCRVQSCQRLGRSNGAPRQQPILCNPVGGDGFNRFPSADTAVDQYRFSFARVYPPEVGQDEIYNEVARPIVKDVMKGYNGTLLVYGQTGSGKTHTMFGAGEAVGRERSGTISTALYGTAGDDRGPVRAQGGRANVNAGIIPRAVNQIFDMIHSADEALEFEIRAMFVEVYMERVRDLLDHGNLNLQVREGPSGFYVENCKLPYVSSAEEMMQLINSGVCRRVTAATACNEASSRSHCVLNITVKSVNHTKHVATVGKLFLVDLAGSEKVAKTHVDGMQLEEAKMINKSLTTLGHVIMSLADKQAHVPYRDSKLTRILKDSLGGNSRTALVVCCSPSQFNDQETLSTLRFGARAQNVCNVAIVNKQLTAEELKGMLDLARVEIKRLRKLLHDMGVTVPSNGNHGGEEISDCFSGVAESSCGGETFATRVASPCDTAVPGPHSEASAVGHLEEADAVINADGVVDESSVNEGDVVRRGIYDELSREGISPDVSHLHDNPCVSQGTTEAIRNQLAEQAALIKLLREENAVWEEEHMIAVRELYGYRRYAEHCREVLGEVSITGDVVSRRISSYRERVLAIVAKLCSHSDTTEDNLATQCNEYPNQIKEGRPSVELGATRETCSSVSNNLSQPLLSSHISSRTTMCSLPALGDGTAGNNNTITGSMELACASVESPNGDTLQIRKNYEELQGRLARAMDEIERLQSTNSVLSLDLQLAEKRLQIRHERIESLKFGLRQESASNQELQQSLERQMSAHRTQLQAARNDALYWRQRYDDLLNHCHTSSSSRKPRATHISPIRRRSLTPTLEGVLVARSPSARAPPSSVATSPGRGVIVKPIRGGGSKLEHAFA